MLFYSSRKLKAYSHFKKIFCFILKFNHNLILISLTTPFLPSFLPFPSSTPPTLNMPSYPHVSPTPQNLFTKMTFEKMTSQVTPSQCLTVTHSPDPAYCDIYFSINYSCLLPRHSSNYLEKIGWFLSLELKLASDFE